MNASSWRTHATPERYLAGAAALSVVIAGVASRSETLAFGSFTFMAAVLISSDLVIYAMTKSGLLKVSRRS